MDVVKKTITIKLNEEDISLLHQIVWFALDLDAEKHCMTSSEKEMTEKIFEITKGEY